MANIKQHYGIKFPFTSNNYDGYFIDLNNTLEDKIASEIAHVILTEKKTRIRKPDFGTDLIKYIFDPSDALTWQKIEDEIKDSVSKYVNGVTINSVDVIRSTDSDNEVYVDVKYGIVKGATIENNRLAIKL